MQVSSGMTRGDVRAWSWVALVGAVSCCGCQTMFPAALPGGLAWSENARIEKRAKADSFPSPADVGLTEPTPVP